VTVPRRKEFGMFLSRFGVKRYKCLGDIDIPLTPIHVLIGENDAGKTSLLEAIAALCASSEKPLAQCFPAPWSGRELVLHGAAQASVELQGEWRSSPEDTPSTVGYGFSVDFPVEGGQCRKSGEWVQLRNEERRSLPSTTAYGETLLSAWKKGQPVAEPAAGHLEQIHKVVTPAHKYALDAKLMATPAATDLNRKFRLDPDGFGLPTLLQDILGYDPGLFIGLRTEFCRFFPQFKSVRLASEKAAKRQYDGAGEVTGSNTVDGHAIYLETKSGESIRAQQASDGAILFLGFLALAYLPKPPNLLLIEESENGIYPKRLGELITMLKEMVHRSEGVRFPQIILSTHSPYVLSFFEPEEVTFLSRPPDDPNGPVRARPLRDAPHIKERLGDGEFYLGELWYNLSEKDLFGDA
jgi:hypothetical protein